MISDSNYGITYYTPPTPPPFPAQTIADFAALGSAAGVPVYNRYQLEWLSIETSANFVTANTPDYVNPVYDWSNLDATVNNCLAAGVPIFWAIQNPPAWWNSLDLNGNSVGYDGNSIRATLGTSVVGSPIIPNPSPTYTSITLASPGLAQAVPNGQVLQIDYFATNNQAVVVSNHGGYAAGTTVITIQAVQFKHNHTAGCQVWNSQNAVFPSVTDYIKFMTVAVKRYKNKIAWYAHGNEEYDTQSRQGVNYISQWDNGGALLAAIAIAGTPIIRQYAPKSKVSICAVRKSPTLAGRHVYNWVTAFFAAGGGPFTDAVDFHYYRNNTSINGVIDQDPTHSSNPNNALLADVPSVAQEIQLIQQVISTYGGNQIVMCTETGWDTLYYPVTPVPTTPVTYDQQNQYQLAMLDAFRTLAPTGKLFIFTYDSHNDSKSMAPTAVTGIQNYISQYPTWLTMPTTPTVGYTFPPDKEQLVRVYDAAYNFVGTWPDAPLLSGIKETINAAATPLRVQLPCKFETYAVQNSSLEQIVVAIGYHVEFWLYGENIAPTGLLKFKGKIDSIEPQIADTGEESVTVTITPPSAALGDNGIVTPITFTNTDPVVIFNYFFSTVNPQTGNTYAYPLSLDPSNPTSSGRTVTYTFKAQNLLSIFNTILLMLPANWYFRCNFDNTNTVTLNVAASTGQHYLYMGQHLVNPSYRQDATQLRNDIYLKGAGTISSHKMGTDIALYGQRFKAVVDNRATDQPTADILCQGYLTALDQLVVRTNIRVVDFRGDNQTGIGIEIENFRPGDTVVLEDPLTSGASTMWDDGNWDASAGAPISTVTQVAAVNYNFDYVDAEIGTLQPNQDYTLFQLQRSFQDFTAI